jgi:hypothetical protein
MFYLDGTNMRILKYPNTMTPVGSIFVCQQNVLSDLAPKKLHFRSSGTWVKVIQQLTKIIPHPQSVDMVSVVVAQPIAGGTEAGGFARVSPNPWRATDIRPVYSL